jgi:transcriptional regulator with XRE-family HTH domain
MSRKHNDFDGDNSVIAVEAATPKKKNRGAPPPQVRRGFGENPEDKQLISRLLNEALTAYRMPKVQNDEELAERFDQYFKMCAETGQLPTVEEMATYTGYTQATVWDWENGRRQGFSARTAEIVKKSKEYLKMFDAKLVLSNKQNAIVYFFRAKNYYSMSDKQELMLTTGDNQDTDMSAEDIAKRYLEDGKTIPTTFTDGVD